MLKPFYDLAVIGAGFAGFGAAVQSARLGMSTLLVESGSQWGGAAHEGMHQSLCGLYLGGENLTSSILNPGLSEEIAEALVSRKQAQTVKTGNVTVLQYDPQALQQVFREWAGQEWQNLDTLFEAQLESVYVEDQQIKEISVRHQNKSRTVKCRALIDCSGRGDGIRLSGASYEIGTAEERQLAAYAFQIDGVHEDTGMLNLKVAYHLAQAAEQGRIASHLRFSVWLAGTKTGQGVLRMSVLPSDCPYEMKTVREQAGLVHAVLKKAMSEFKDSNVKSQAASVVEREGLRMNGRYTLTKEDVLTAKKFKDGGVKSAWPIEFWDQGKGPRHDYLEEGCYYEIPSECLQSTDVTNLFAAGRCISADAQALASARVTGTCLALGEQAALTVEAYLRAKPETPLNIVSIIKEETKKYHDRTALRQGGRSIAYGDLLSKVEQLAQVLKDFPIKRYARVGILVHEGIDYVILNLAVLALQAVIVPIPQSSSKDEIERIRCDIKLDLLIFEKSLYQTKEEAPHFLSAFGQCLFHRLVFRAEMKEQKEFESLNPAFIRFTSGTTGQSKGVVISHEAIQRRTDAADQALKMTPEDVVIWVLSMSYHFLVTTLLFLRRGAAIVLCDHEIPRGLIEGLEDGDATFIYAAPVHYQAMVHTSEIKPVQCRNIRMAVSTTTHLSAQTAGEFSDKFGFELCTAYGVIELGLPFVNDSKLSEKRQSVGRLTGGYECRLAQPDKEGVGIVQIKGPGLFEAYFSPWKTKEAITREGWFETGDLGRLDGDGFLFLWGRYQQVINFLGMKIFPREVEDVLQQYPVIEQSHVYGEEHSVYGQMPCAKIILKPDQSDFDEGALRKFCYTRLASYKVPKKFEIVKVLKITKSGKIKVDQ